MSHAAYIAGLAILAMTRMASADAPRVEAATATHDPDGTWTISVTLSHPDTGWDHYASGWRLLTSDGTEIATRELSHPHVDEQPFTRSLSGVTIPDGTAEILIQPRCTMDGWVPMPTILALPQK